MTWGTNRVYRCGTADTDVISTIRRRRRPFMEKPCFFEQVDDASVVLFDHLVAAGVMA